jgi:hypothetical protein
MLPGVADNLPQVDVAQVGAAVPPSNRVSVTVRWKAPNEPAGDPVRSVTVVAEMK